MPAGDYFKDAMLNHVFSVADMTMPVPYLGFSTTATSGSSIGTEVVGGSYARIDISSYMAAASGGVIASDTNILIEDMPSCTITDAFITAGNPSTDIIWYYTLAAPVVLTAGQDFNIRAGDLIAGL